MTLTLTTRLSPTADKGYRHDHDHCDIANIPVSARRASVGIRVTDASIGSKRARSDQRD